jgi:hypothetical protein
MYTFCELRELRGVVKFSPQTITTAARRSSIRTSHHNIQQLKVFKNTYISATAIHNNDRNTAKKTQTRTDNASISNYISLIRTQFVFKRQKIVLHFTSSEEHWVQFRVISFRIDCLPSIVRPGVEFLLGLIPKFLCRNRTIAATVVDCPL